MELPPNLVMWIIRYLTERSQFVYLRSSDSRSSLLCSNTGAPQGTVLAPFLFTAYTADFQICDNNCILVKFADDTALIGLIKSDDNTTYVNQVNSFVDYCKDNYLELNVSKTKELVIDYRKQKPDLDHIMINNSAVQRTNNYKYLGVVIDDNLMWHDHINHLCKKLNPRLFCLRKLYKFGVDKKILQLFYDAVICSVWKYCLCCWGGNARAYDTDRISSTIRQASRLIGEDLDTFDLVYEEIIRKKLNRVRKNCDHPLHDVFSRAIIERSGRMRLPRAKTNRYKSSFVSQAISVYNKDFKR